MILNSQTPCLTFLGARITELQVCAPCHYVQARGQGSTIAETEAFSPSVSPGPLSLLILGDARGDA